MEKVLNQKMEAGLSLGTTLSREELLRSEELSTGYEETENLWEVILRYNGSAQDIRNRYPGVYLQELRGQYAVAEITASGMEYLAKDPAILYMEKPKQLYFEKNSYNVNEAYSEGVPWRRRDSEKQMMENQLQYYQLSDEHLTGKGVLTATIDTGINLEESQFRNPDGTSRVAALMDQVTEQELETEEINEMLQAKDAFQLPGRDTKGHGNDVAAIAAGNYGTAPESSLIIVKMGMSKRQSFPRTTNLMKAVDYCLEKSEVLHMPVAINISFGNNYGSHHGDSLVETYLNAAASVERCVICVGSGNEGLGQTHAEGIMESFSMQEIELVIRSYEMSIGIQIWKNYYDKMEIEVIAPGGEVVASIRENQPIGSFFYRQTILHSIYGAPSPFSMQQEIYLDLQAAENSIEPGVWRIRMKAGAVKDGRYDIYLPSVMALNVGTGFTKTSSSRTATVPSIAENVISVGAYDGRTWAAAPFSGRGYAGRTNGIMMAKPELVAPGVEIRMQDGHRVTGTSFATPFVTGRAAQLMEYGIVRGKDPYLYGAKLKAKLIEEAESLMGLETPNARTGWGALSVRDS